MINGSYIKFFKACFIIRLSGVNNYYYIFFYTVALLRFYGYFFSCDCVFIKEGFLFFIYL
jgi:hypothetical protein